MAGRNVSTAKPERARGWAGPDQRWTMHLSAPTPQLAIKATNTMNTRSEAFGFVTRALQVLKRHLALRADLRLQGKIDHEDLFFKEDGIPIGNLQYSWVRWKRALQRMKVRYQEPYNARHSSVSWNLMIGNNPLWVAKQHRHSVQTMLEVYAAWTEGAKEADQTGDAIVAPVARSYRETNSARSPPIPGIWH
jgi:integrase